MPKKNNGLVMFCLLLCVCFGLAGYTIAVTPVYDQRDVAVINRLIEENDLDLPKNMPQEWDDRIGIGWSETYPKRIEWLWFGAEQPIGTADLSDLQQLQSLFWHTVTDTLILPENVEQVYCSYNQLKQLDCSKAKQLKKLQCEGNQLTELDLSISKELELIAVNDNQLTRLTFQNLPNLTALHCQNNQLTELNLPDLPSLKILDCWANQLKQLQFKNVPKLESVWCYDNQLQELDTAELEGLINLRCEGNQLQQLSVKNLTQLERLTCYDNPLEQLQLENLPSLCYLDCGRWPSMSLNGDVQLKSFDYETGKITVTNP